MARTRRITGAGSRRPLRSAVEQLEDRSVPSVVGTSYVYDDWTIIVAVPNSNPNVLTNGDTVRNDNDTINRGKIVGVYGTDAFSSINAAIANTVPDGVVDVLDGTYAENVVVNESLTLEGAQAGVGAPTRTGVPETIVEPGPTSSYDTDSVFQVTASNVTIDGFTIQGSISGTPPMGQSTGFALDTGTTVYAAAGVSNSSNVNTGGSAPSTTNVSDLTVQNDIIQDFTQVGVYGDTSDGTVSSGNTIANNLIRDVPNNGDGGYYGEGAIIYDNFYANVTGNTITNVRTGVQTGNNYLSAGTFAPSISNNAVSASIKGIYLNLQYESASPFTVSDNTITGTVGTVSPLYDVGLLVQSIQSSVQETIQGNNVSGFLYGVEFAGNDTTNTVTLQGGTLNANTYGVWATNNDYFYPADYDTTAALNGVTITNSTNAGIWVDSTSPDSTGTSNATNTVSLGIGGGTVVTGGDVGLMVSGGLAAVAGNTLNDTSFSGQSGNYITLANGAEDNNEIDGTGATYGGVQGSSATPAEGFAIEDKILDAIDAPGLGLVRLTAGNIYVTPNSFYAPGGTTVPSIQRGIDAATAGDTVNVAAGTYPGDVTLNEAVTLAGSATITGALSVTAASGAIISPGTGTGAGLISATSLGLNSGTQFVVDVNGPSAGTDFDQLSAGTVDLGGAALTFRGNAVFSPGTSLVLIDDTGSGPIVGTFAGIAEGGTVTLPSGQNFTFSYVGGTGNDATITASSAPPSGTAPFTVPNSPPVSAPPSGTAPITVPNSPTVSAPPSGTAPITVPTVQHLFAVGAGATGGGHVDVFNADGSLRFSFFAFPNFNGSVQVATGDVNGDGVDDIAVGAGPGGNSAVKVFDGATGALISSFYAFAGYDGGVSVAIGNVTGTGAGDVIVGSSTNNSAVKVFDGSTGAPLMSFYAFAGYDGGVSVAAGDFTGGGAAEVIVGAAGNGPAAVKAIDYAGQTLASFIANASTTGINVSAGVLPNSTLAELLVAPASGNGPIQVFAAGTAAPTATFNANFAGTVNGLSVATGDATNSGQNEILVTAGPGQNAVVEVFDPTTFTQVGSVTAFDGFLGGVSVG